jgi:LDH2 family malate/lactate/ureidoglycolate dehydrogenase
MPENMPGKGLGHFFGAMRIDAFRPAEEFKAHMDNWIERFRAATPAPGYDRVLIPGDPERETAALRSVQGIPIHEAVEKDLSEIAERLGIVPL